MELTKHDTQMAKGMALLGMVMLHLFCRLEDLPYSPLIWFGDTPLIYYLGLFGDICVPVYCFCSGYAHYLMADSQKKNYAKRIPGKALRFLCNYWIVVVLFSILGLIVGKSGTIPEGWGSFLRNLFLISTSYNGAWWFVATYLLLLAASPQMAALTRRVNGFLLLAVSFLFYFVAHILRFNHPLTFANPVVQWCWRQGVLFVHSQFAYLIGMVCRKYAVVGKVRTCLQTRPTLRCAIVWLLPAAAFFGHCLVQSVIVAPFTAAAAMIGLFLAQLPRWAKQGFLFLGKHSTNIWLVHMFFFAGLFPNFVFCAKYPVLILALMLALCVCASMVIELLYRPVTGLLDRKS